MAPKLSDSINVLRSFLVQVGEKTGMEKCLRDEYTISHLTRELRLLRGICCCAEKFLLQDQTLESFFNHLRQVINKKIREIFHVHQEIRKGLELDDTRGDALLSSFIEAVETLRPLFEKAIDKYMHSSEANHCTMEELLEFIQLVSLDAKAIHSGSSLESLQMHKLDFLKDFISFAASRGVGEEKLRELLAHTRVVAITAAFCSYMLLRPEVIDKKTRFLIYTQNSEMLKVLPVIILKASKSSCYSDYNKINSLLKNLLELLNSDSSFTVSFVKILIEELSFLRNFLKYQRQEGADLDEEIANLICDVVSEAGMIFYSLCSDDLKEETQLRLSNWRGKVQFLKQDIAKKYMETLYKFPRTNEHDSILMGPELLDSTQEQSDLNDTLMTYLGWLVELLTSESTFRVCYFIKILVEELRFLRNFLRCKRQQDGDLDEEMAVLTFDVVSEARIEVWDDLEEVSTTGTKRISNWMEKVQLLNEDIAKKYPETLRYKFPRTNELVFMDGLIEDLKELIRYKPDSIAFAQGQLDVVLGDLVFLRDFLRDMVKQRNEHQGLKHLWFRVVDVAYRSEFVINSLVVGDPMPDCSPTSFNAIKGEIKKIRAEVEEMGKSFQIEASNTPKISNLLPSKSSNPTMDEVVVGFEDEAEKIIRLLHSNSAELDIVSIVGMPGQGKTTLAKKVYNDIKSDFHVCAWCCVSQGYQKRKLLLDILSDIIDVKKIDVEEKCGAKRKQDDGDLEDVLRKLLKGRRYLIVLDDIWDIEAWRDLKSSFPNDHNQSRILLTSRVALQTKLDSKLHFLRLLNDEESRELLQKKLLHHKSCPVKLQNLGMKIAEICKGLPLAVVTVAGILATLERDRWEDFAEVLSTAFVSGTEECTELLELSYIHLPDYLKPCLLYFGSFLQDEEIPISRLIWLWMAEGLVQKTTDEKSLENVAEDYLKDLINRSLVMVVKQTSRGGIKACSVHDLVHKFCVTRAKEENFLHLLNLKERTGPLSEPRRLCIYSWKGVQCFRRLSSLKCFDNCFYTDIEVSYILCNFKILKVLDLRGICCDLFPAEVEMLVHLRFLAVAGDFYIVPSTIVKLWNLETFLLISGKISLPYTLLNMTKLRHVRVNRIVVFSLPEQNLEKCCESSNLEIFSTALLSSEQDMVKIIRKMPYLRKLKCTFLESWDVKYQFPALNFLSQLESLKVHSTGMVQYQLEFSFPLSLKKLTLSNFYLPWASISRFAELPNLEVLKLVNRACEGETWGMEEEEVFRKLQFLKFEDLNIVHWDACSDNFPRLRQLVVHNCRELQGIPSGVGEVDSLEIVEVKYCHPSVVTSAQNLKEEKEGLKAFIQ